MKKIKVLVFTTTVVLALFVGMANAESVLAKEKIVFASDRSGNWDIWMVDPDGTNLEQLTTDSSSDTSPQISPDGTVMAQETQTTLFEDDFSELNLNKWTLFGSPSPRVLASLEGRSGVFDNNGDGWCDSGAVSKDTFSFPNGFTMESDVYVSVTNIAGCWDAAVIGLTKENTPYMDHPNCPSEGYYTGLKFGIFYTGDACWATPQEKRRHAYFDISLLTEDGSGEGPGSYAINADDYIDGWHNLKIVVGEDGFVSFYCDDKLIYKSEKRISEDILQDKKIYLGQRSSGSAGKAYHDFVKITSANGISPTPTPTEEPLSTEIRGVFVRPTDLIENLNIKDEGGVNDRIKKMAIDLKNHNINVVFVAFKSDFDGKTFYIPDNFPDAYYFTDYDLAYDPMKNMVDIFRDHNIEVHAWVPVFHDKFLIDNSDEICIELGFSTPGEVRQPYKKDKDSEIEYSEEFADPNNPCVIKYEKSIIKKILEKYQVNGINLDYIRYDDSNAYFDDETKSWVSSYTISKEIYKSDGADKIVDFVESISNLCCKENIILSADVFGDIDYAKNCVGQNIPSISKYVNVLMPMLYGRCPKGEGEEGIDYSVKKFKKHGRLVVPCVRAFNWDFRPGWAPECTPLEPTPEDVKQLIRDSEKSGDGFALFNYMTIVGKQWGINIYQRLDWNDGLDEINEVLSNPVITPWKKSNWVNLICQSDRLPTVIPPGIPAFEAVFALAGLLAVAYLLKRRK